MTRSTRAALWRSSDGIIEGLNRMAGENESKQYMKKFLAS